MALTSKDLFDFANSLGAAQTHGIVPSAGHAILADAAGLPAASALPTQGGDAPPLSAGVDANMPVVAPQPAIDPNAIVPYPGVSSALHEKLVAHFGAQAAQAQAASEAARNFLGPNGPIGQLYADSAERSRQAGDETAAAEQRKAAGDAVLAGQEAERAAREQRQDEIRMKARDKMVGDYQRRADVLADQAQNIEVRNFWADKSTGSRILGILAQTLSGAANGLAGNPGAPSALDRIIDRDLQVQEKNMQNKRLAADQAQNALAHVYKGFETQDASIAAYRQAASKWVQAKSNELAAQFQGDTANSRNQMVQAQMQQKVADSQAKIAESAAQAADRLHLAADDNSVQLARDESNLGEVYAAHHGDTVDVPGVSVPVRKSLVNSAWTKQSQSFAGGLAQLDHIEKLVNKPGFKVADLAGSEAGSALLKGDFRQILGTGANLSAEESKDLNSLVVRYLKLKGVDSISALGAPDIHKLIGGIRTSVARTLQARIRATFPGGDLKADPGFESARAAIDADEAQ